MPNDKLAKIIDHAFEGRDKIGPKTKGAVRKAVDFALALLDRGEARVAERAADGRWQVNQWLKKAVLLSFRLNDMSVIAGGPGKAVWWDKVDSKFKGWNAARFRKSGFRAVPGAVVRRSAYIAPGVVLMPSFVNLGAYVDSGTMIDTWATVGSCAQIGKNCHLSGGVGIGGVLEPLQAGPVVDRGQLFHRRALGSGRRRDRARRLRARHGRLYRDFHQDRRSRNREGLSGRGAALFGRRIRERCPASLCRAASRGRISIAQSSSSASMRRRARRRRSTSC